MIPHQDELLLIAVAFGIYVYDSALLLHFNEGIMSPRVKAGWYIWIGSDANRWMGKHVFVPNPITPHRPLYRLSWQIQSDPTQTTFVWVCKQDALRPLVPLIWGMVFALFVFFPIGLLAGLGYAPVLAAIIFLYLNIISALLWLWFRRDSLGLTGRRLAALAFESVICSPCALNLMRKVALGMQIEEDLFKACWRLQTPDEWEMTRLKLLARLDEQMELEDDESEQWAPMQARRRMLVESRATCHSQNFS